MSSATPFPSLDFHSEFYDAPFNPDISEFPSSISKFLASSILILKSIFLFQYVDWWLFFK